MSAGSRAANAAQASLSDHARPFRELRAGVAQDGDQTQFVQDAGPQIARDALHFFGRLAEQLAEFRSPRRFAGPSRGRKFVRQRLAADEDGAEQLGDVVVQFEGHAPALGFLHLHHAVRQGPQHFLVAPGLRHVRHHHADDRVVRNLRWPAARMEICAGMCEPSPAWSSTWILEPDLAGPFHERSERGPVCGGEKAAKGTAHHLLQRAFDHAGEALVGVQNHLVRRQRQRPFVHGFDEHAVGVLGAFQREHLRAFLARDHHRIHLAGADGAERFLGVGQAGAEFGEFAGLARGAVGAWLAACSFHSAILPFVIKSNSTNRPVMFVRLPMNRRTGGGNSMMSVGVATIWFARASSGC